jgi:ribonuclease BN (tRNA processing enzyme)
MNNDGAATVRPHTESLDRVDDGTAHDDAVTVRFVGSGDAFGSGGRLQTCFLVDAPDVRFLIDCGASSMIGLAAQGVNPESIDAVVLTHFHGDHCGGVAFLLLHAMVVSRRKRPLLIAGPPGTQAHIARLMEALFPGSQGLKPRFELAYVEVEAGHPSAVGRLIVRNWPAVHTAETEPTIVRVEVSGRAIVYTGDTAWTPAIVEACDGADLLVAECYYLDVASRWHMDYATLQAHKASLKARRIVLTHPSEAVLERASSLEETLAYDGLVIRL